MVGGGGADDMETTDREGVEAQCATVDPQVKDS